MAERQRSVGLSSAWLYEHPTLSREIQALPHRRVEVQPSQRSLLLLGVISVSEDRRELLRCTWVPLFTSLPMRLRFVLGRNANDSHYADVLTTPVEERMLAASSNRLKTRQSAGATFSSLSSFYKTYHFFKWAASQPEPLVALGDDDVFIQPHMLLAHALLLHEMLARDVNMALAAGAIEWYSWREATLVATGWERGRVGAMEKAQAAWRDCSPSGTGWLRLQNSRPVEASRSKTAKSDPCHGPFPFFKGPLVIFSSSVVRWLNASALVARDVNQAAELAAGRARTYKGPGSGRIPQDVSLGFWLSRHPTLHLVDIQPYTRWSDRWRTVGDLRELLVAHRVPWDRMAWLTESTRRLWTDSDHVARGRLSCAEPVCQPQKCASKPGQVACRIEVALPAASASSADYGCYMCKCWGREAGQHDRQWSNGTCRFSRKAVPHVPGQCWRGRESVSG